MARCAQNILFNAENLMAADAAFRRYYSGHKPKLIPLDPSVTQGMDIQVYNSLDAAPPETTGLVVIAYNNQELFPS
jgi:hypothetical protein